MTGSKKEGDQQFPPPQLNEEAVRKIGAKLRQEFDQVAKEPVPDRFASLLDQLEQQGAASEGDPDV